jgi:hypothetical protein
MLPANPLFREANLLADNAPRAAIASMNVAVNFHPAEAPEVQTGTNMQLLNMQRLRQARD